jgi:hypothetical protein
LDAVTQAPLVEVAVEARVLLVQRRLLQLPVLAGLEQHRQFLAQALLMGVVAVVAVGQVQQVV